MLVRELLVLTYQLRPHQDQFTCIGSQARILVCLFHLIVQTCNTFLDLDGRVLLAFTDGEHSSRSALKSAADKYFRSVSQTFALALLQGGPSFWLTEIIHP